MDIGSRITKKPRPNVYSGNSRRAAPEKAHHPSANVRKPPKAQKQRIVKSISLDTASLQKTTVILISSCLGVLAFLGLGIGMVQLYHYIITTPILAVNEIEVKGNSYLNTQDILDQSGLTLGENSLSVQISQVEENLMKNPWIESVIIQRILPEKFVIEVKERSPRFWVLKDNILHYLDKDGLFIAPVEHTNFISLPTLDIGPGGETALNQLADFMEVLKTAKLPLDPSQVSWLRISAGKGFELYWEKKHLSLSIGFEDWKSNLTYLALVIEDIEKRNEIGNVREIRAADGQVWVQKG